MNALRMRSNDWPKSEVIHETGDSQWTQEVDNNFKISVIDSSIALVTDLYSSGLNGALRRWPNVETQTLSLFDKRAGLTPSWKPHWSRVPTVGLTFPLGFEFQPKPDEAVDGLKKIEPPKVADSELTERAARPTEKKVTRFSAVFPAK